MKSTRIPWDGEILCEVGRGFASLGELPALGAHEISPGRVLFPIPAFVGSELLFSLLRAASNLTAYS